MDLLDKAFALCEEIEQRQRELKEILTQLAENKVEDSPKTTPEPEARPDSNNTCQTATIVEPETAFIQESSVAIHQRPDIRKAFTINDRFRFRRELFAGDDSALKAVIEHLATLNTLAEADDYLSTMMWDHDNEAISEFMTIVSNHFNSK